MPAATGIAWCVFFALNVYAGIGWYQVPPSEAGGVMPDLSVWIGRFVVTGDEARAGAQFSMTGTIGYDHGIGTGVHYAELDESFTFVPSPGTLGFIGLGAIMHRRKRRK